MVIIIIIIIDDECATVWLCHCLFLHSHLTDVCATPTFGRV